MLSLGKKSEKDRCQYSLQEARKKSSRTLTLPRNGKKKKKRLLTRKGFGKSDLKVKGMYVVRVSIKMI